MVNSVIQIAGDKIISGYWYALCVKNRAEKKVYERLNINGYHAYLPLQTKIHVWSDRKKEVQVPLISSYVFVKTNMENLFETTGIPGVTGVLKWLGKPAVIREHEIENLKILMNNNGQVELTDFDAFKKGEEVEVIKGPFSGLIARTLQMKGKYRIAAIIESMGFAFSADIPLSFVRKRKTL